MSTDKVALAHVVQVLNEHLTHKIEGVSLAPGASIGDAVNELVNARIHHILDDISDVTQSLDVNGNTSINLVKDLRGQIGKLESEAFMREDTIECQKVWLMQRAKIIFALLDGRELDVFEKFHLEVLKEWRDKMITREKDNCFGEPQ